MSLIGAALAEAGLLQKWCLRTRGGCRRVQRSVPTEGLRFGAVTGSSLPLQQEQCCLRRLHEPVPKLRASIVLKQGLLSEVDTFYLGTAGINHPQAALSASVNAAHCLLTSHSWMRVLRLQ